MKKLILLLALGAVCVAQAQTTNAPLTYFAAYNAVCDAPLLKSMSTIGVLNNQIGNSVEVRAERLINLQNTNAVFAVSLRTHTSQQVFVDYIDYDELDGLIRGIQLISKADHSASPMDNFEAVYRTRGGLSILKISNGNKFTIVMKPGDPSGGRNQMAPYVLDDLGRYLAAAKDKLNSIAASGR